MAYEKVVIIGGGFAGLNAALGLKKLEGEVLIIDKTNHHLFQPLLYQVATCALSPANIAYPIREIFRNYPNTKVIMGDVVDFDLVQHQVIMGNDDKFPFTKLIIATGTSHSYFGHEEWEKLAPGLKTLQDARQIREQLLVTFEKAERLDDQADLHKYLRVVIVGGGPTGVEMAGAIAEITRKTLSKNFRRFNPDQTEVILIEGEKQLLPSFDPKLAEIAKKDLEKFGVKVYLNELVEEISEQGVRTKNRFLETFNVVWAAGNQASPLLKKLHVPLDRAGRVIVNPDLTIPGHPDVFVLGDAAHFASKEGPLPGIAPVAIQQGQYIAKKILGKIQKPFVYNDKGTLATIGKAKAVGEIKGFKVSGFIAWWVWCVVHIFYLISFSNRLLVLTQWVFWYLSGKRQVRLISKPAISQEEAKEGKSGFLM